MNKLNKAILVSLLADLNPWEVRPTHYGASAEGYGANDRVSRAGTTWTELHAAGLSIGGDTHDRYMAGWKDLADAEKDLRNRNYRLAHGGQLAPDTRVNAKYRSPDGLYCVGSAGVDARVNPSSCPSGLRPRIIKGSHKTENVSAWHSLLVSAVASTPDGGMVEIPDLDALGGVPTEGSDSPRRTRTASGPTGYRAYLSYRGTLAATLTDLVSLLRNGSELPAQTSPVADALEAFAYSLPVGELDKVTADCFDTSIIREGSLVSVTPGAPVLGSINFMSRALPQVPSVFTVVSINEGIASITADGFRRAIPTPLTTLRRYVPPAPVAVGTTNWTPTAGLLAFIGTEEVFVVSIDGETVTVEMIDGEVANVSKADLRASAE